MSLDQLRQRMRARDRVLAGLTGAASGVALGLAISGGAWGAVAVGGLLAYALAILARSLVPPEERRGLVRLALLAFGVHAAAVALIYTGSVALGRHGFITGDDGGYAHTALCLVRYLANDPLPFCVPPYWGGDAYLFGTWVYLETALFAVFGPDVLVPELVNAAFATAAALLVFNMSRRLFGRVAALIAGALAAFFPSIVVWSALNLKDALALFLLTLALWALVRFQQRATPLTLVAVFLILLPIESVRRYLYVGLAMLVPITVALAPRLPRRRTVWLAAALLASATFIATAEVGFALGPGLLAAAEGARGAMAVGARTHFETAPPAARIGEAFVVPTASPPPTPAPAGSGTPRPSAEVTPTPAPAGSGTPRPSAEVTPTPAPTCQPGEVNAGPNTRIFVSTSPRPSVAPVASPWVPPDVLTVCPGDTIVLGPPGTAVAVTRPLPAEVGASTSVPAPPEDSLAIRTLAYLPRGLAYALFAPAPWMLTRSIDLLVIPDMLLWYVIFAAALAACWRERAGWRIWAPVALYVGGLLFLLSLAEGNVGTLYRHRAMLIPPVIVMASPALRDLVARARRAL